MTATRRSRRQRARYQDTTSDAQHSDFGPQIILSMDDRGRQIMRDAIPREIEDVAVGSRSTVKRARRAEPLLRMGLPSELIAAAILWRQAFEHMATGLPWRLADTGREPRRSDGVRMVMLAQERAVSAAAAYRAGMDAMGETAVHGVARFVVLDGWSLSQYDAYREWREGLGKVELVAALRRLLGVEGFG